jgi:hypothetical protein
MALALFKKEKKRDFMKELENMDSMIDMDDKYDYIMTVKEEEDLAISLSNTTKCRWIYAVRMLFFLPLATMRLTICYISNWSIITEQTSRL